MKGKRISYGAAEMAWLEANRMMVISDLHRAFVAEFGRQDVSAVHLHGLRKRKGWKVGRTPGRTAGRSWRYSLTEIDWLRENCTLPIADYHSAFVKAFARNDVTIAMLRAVRKNRGWKTGRTGQFGKGQAPMNKGKTCPPGKGGRHPNAIKTQFKRGQEPHNTKQAGHERIGSDGYVWISVEETNPYTGYERRYVQKHILLWEALNGPIPEGHCLKSLDDDRSNCAPSNWALIERALLPVLNGGAHKRYPAFAEVSPELRPAILTLAKVVQARARKRRLKSAAS